MSLVRVERTDAVVRVVLGRTGMHNALVPELPHHLYTYHGCGLGRFLDETETRAVLAARLASLVRRVRLARSGLPGRLGQPAPQMAAALSRPEASANWVAPGISSKG